MEKIAKIQLAKINKMLMAMAQGNFFYRLERSDNNDNVEAMSLVLNMLAEEIQETLVHGGFVNTTGVVRQLVQLSFFMDNKGIVKMANHNVCKILAYLRQDIIGKSFELFLDDNSVKTWSKLLRKARKRDFYDTTLDLTFVSKEGLIIPHNCHVSTSCGLNPDDRHILVAVVLQAKDSQERNKRDHQAAFKGKKSGKSSEEAKDDKSKNQS